MNLVLQVVRFEVIATPHRTVRWRGVANISLDPESRRLFCRFLESGRSLRDRKWQFGLILLKNSSLITA